jgi:hypothetical protein
MVELKKIGLLVFMLLKKYTERCRELAAKLESGTMYSQSVFRIT